MPARFRSQLTYANVMATIAVFIALGGTSYAALKVTGKNVPKDALTGADIKNLTGKDVTNESLTGADIKNLTSGDIVNGSLLAEDFGLGQIPKGDTGPAGPAGPEGPEGPQGPAGPGFAGAAAGGALAGTYPNPSLADGAVTSANVLDDNQVGGGLSATDLAANSVGQSEIATDGVAALEIQDNSIDSGEIVDFQLTNQDVGVLFAEVSAAGTLDNSSGGVTTTKIGAVGTGTYEVDFARNITACTAVATIGEAGAGVVHGRGQRRRPRRQRRGRVRRHEHQRRRGRRSPVPPGGGLLKLSGNA